MLAKPLMSYKSENLCPTIVKRQGTHLRKDPHQGTGMLQSHTSSLALPQGNWLAVGWTLPGLSPIHLAYDEGYTWTTTLSKLEEFSSTHH